ncbi:hypothetical protein CRENBAI_024146 [Crenichthys baileyi]|uniref:Uncharacterized protein n=1 Tax=Crenichthys baileyi TaxID=28760 RepID=A0AAV9SPM3_9TELE
MLLPSSCLCFGRSKPQNATAGTSQQDQADKNKELQKWVQQQEEELRRRNGEEVEIAPSLLLLQEMEEAEGRRSMPVSPDFMPGPICSSFPSTDSATSASSQRRPQPQQLPQSHPRLQRLQLRPNFPLGSLGRCGQTPPTPLRRVHPPWPPRSCFPRSWWVATQRPLQAEFLAEGWLDAPASLSAGGPFDPLLIAINATKL